MKKNSIKEIRVAFPMFTNAQISRAFKKYQIYVEAGMEGDSIADMGKSFSWTLGNRKASVLDFMSLARYFRDNYYELRD